MSSMSSMSAPRRSARIAAKAAKVAPVAPIAPQSVAPQSVAPHPIAEVVAPSPTDTLADVQQIREALIRCDKADGQLARIKASTEMFDLLRTACLWEHSAEFRCAVENKITEYLEKEIPTCLHGALEMYDRPLEWAMYDLQDAVENLKEMMNGCPVSMVQVKLQKLQRKLTAEVDELGNDLDYCHYLMQDSYRAAYKSKVQELEMVNQRLKNLRQ